MDTDPASEHETELRMALTHLHICDEKPDDYCRGCDADTHLDSLVAALRAERERADENEGWGQQQSEQADELTKLLFAAEAERDAALGHAATAERELDRLDRQATVWHADDCQVQRAIPPWRCTCDANKLRARAEAAVREAATLREALYECDRYINWNEPRIEVTAEVPTAAVALARARAALAASPAPQDAVEGVSEPGCREGEARLSPREPMPGSRVRDAAGTPVDSGEAVRQPGSLTSVPAPASVQEQAT